MLDFYRIRTWHGSYLCLDRSSSRIMAGAASALDDAHPALLACLPFSVADWCLLAAHADPAVPLSLPPHGSPGVLLPLGLRSLDHDGRVALFHPLTRRFLCAAPAEAPNRFGAVAAEPGRVHEFETYVLDQFDPALVPPGIAQSCAAAARLLSFPLSAEAIVELLEQVGSREAGAVLGAVMPLLSLAEMELFAGRLLASPRLPARLAALLPDDIWARLGLPALAEWLARRESEAPGPRKSHIGPAFDCLAEAGVHGALASFGHAANTYARASVRPRRELCIIASARNEGIYLLEWLAWHRSLGVGEVFLYSNDNDDGSDELLGALADAGIVTWTDNRVAPGGWVQAKAYAHAFGILPDVLDYRWALVIDLDEFLVPNPELFGSAVEFVQWHEMRQADAIAINWVFVGSNGERFWRDEPVTRRFACRDPEANAHVKSLCRPHRSIHSHPHFPITDDRRAFIYRHASGGLHTWHNARSQGDLAPAFSDHPNADHAGIYHYFYKSAEEFLWKFMRNRGDAPNAPGLLSDRLNKFFLAEFVRQHEAGNFVPDDRIAAFAPKFDAELAHLQSLPGVAGANARAQSNYRRLIAQMKQRFRSEDALRGMDEAGRRFLRLAGVWDS
jgi:hypothetical protein